MHKEIDLLLQVRLRWISYGKVGLQVMGLNGEYCKKVFSAYLKPIVLFYGSYKTFILFVL